MLVISVVSQNIRNYFFLYIYLNLIAILRRHNQIKKWMKYVINPCFFAFLMHTQALKDSSLANACVVSSMFTLFFVKFNLDNISDFNFGEGKQALN